MQFASAIVLIAAGVILAVSAGIMFFTWFTLAASIRAIRKAQAQAVSRSERNGVRVEVFDFKRK